MLVVIDTPPYMESKVLHKILAYLLPTKVLPTKFPASASQYNERAYKLHLFKHTSNPLILEKWSSFGFGDASYKLGMIRLLRHEFAEAKVAFENGATQGSQTEPEGNGACIEALRSFENIVGEVKHSYQYRQFLEDKYGHMRK